MIFGFLNIDKPRGMTSHDVVNHIRRIIRTRQVGHAGTLDPMATGVLIICAGAATRLSDYVMSDTKAYRAVVRLGVETDTYDADGKVLAEADASAISRQQVEDALAGFRGDILQTPPAFSAIKRGGKKLYELARQGKAIELPPRPISIFSLEIVEWGPPQVTLNVVCSAGTYIRSIAHDLGAALGVGAHLTGLTRTASGGFQLAQATPLDTLIASQGASTYLIPPAVALRRYPRITLEAAEIDDLRHGRKIPAESLLADGADAVGGNVVMAFDLLDRLAAVCALRDGWLHPSKVFAETPDDSAVEDDPAEYETDSR
ncbi:MAG: tRNA pseudouridine(55) synthase TruB [Anaerolineae bacterium]|nr:tRNA pseudouridine(55) synthase TruB [Anaerolineae bacterium]NUQ04718.1 tRNA pseudouridine(55) synthase TruB [Anaerolineae bacterium]